jgi:hypothetical protein
VSRPAVEVADILHAQGDTFVAQHPWLSVQQRSVLRAIARCRTAALGGHVDRCDACGHQAISYNSCRNRHCPKCQAQARERWLQARERELLDVPYVHVVFTLPHALLPLAYRNSARLYSWLVQTSATPLREVAADSRHLGAEIGVLSILHTGDRPSSAIPMCTASCQRAASPPITSAGSGRSTRTSSCP